MATGKNRAAAALGKKGGRAKTPAKQAAARANGAKGGRPSAKEETWRADAAEARATRLASALRILIERHEDEINGGAPITGEEWEIASYALPRIDSDA